MVGPIVLGVLLTLLVAEFIVEQYLSFWRLVNDECATEDKLTSRRSFFYRLGAPLIYPFMLILLFLGVMNATKREEGVKSQARKRRLLRSLGAYIAGIIVFSTVTQFFGWLHFLEAATTCLLVFLASFFMTLLIGSIYKGIKEGDLALFDD